MIKVLKNITKNFIKGISDWVDIYLSGIHVLLRKAAPVCHGRLLDVGCGRKPYQHIFRPYVTQYAGVENRQTFQLTHDSLKATADYYYDGVKLPFDDRTFDTVLSVSVLEHTPDPSHLFAEMARVLHPGGIMIQHVPFSFRLHEEPHDYYRFSKHILRHLCEKNGLVVKEILPQGSLWSVIGHKLTTFLAFRVARMATVAQTIDKLGMESVSKNKPRYWIVPIVAPMIFLITLFTKVMEVIPISDDTLAFMLIAEKPAD